MSSGVVEVKDEHQLCYMLGSLLDISGEKYLVKLGSAQRWVRWDLVQEKPADDVAFDVEEARLRPARPLHAPWTQPHAGSGGACAWCLAGHVCRGQVHGRRRGGAAQLVGGAGQVDQGRVLQGYFCRARRGRRDHRERADPAGVRPGSHGPAVKASLCQADLDPRRPLRAPPPTPDRPARAACAGSCSRTR